MDLFTIVADDELSPTSGNGSSTSDELIKLWREDIRRRRRTASPRSAMS